MMIIFLPSPVSDVSFIIFCWKLFLIPNLDVAFFAVSVVELCMSHKFRGMSIISGLHSFNGHMCRGLLLFTLSFFLPLRFLFSSFFLLPTVLCLPFVITPLTRFPSSSSSLSLIASSDSVSSSSSPCLASGFHSSLSLPSSCSCSVQWNSAEPPAHTCAKI